MNFNRHSNLEGQHAFLGASKYHWINYDEAKVVDVYSNFLAAQKGTVLHEFAAQCIRLGQRLPKSQKTLNMYVNDAIGYRMTPEQVLFYSENCFGTTDAIAFRNNLLRIHDFKSGVVPAHMEQLRSMRRCSVWNIPCARRTSRSNCGFIRTARSFMRTQRQMIFCRSWRRSLHSTKSSIKFVQRRADCEPDCGRYPDALRRRENGRRSGAGQRKIPPG